MSSKDKSRSKVLENTANIYSQVKRWCKKNPLEGKESTKKKHERTLNIQVVYTKKVDHRK